MDELEKLFIENPDIDYIRIRSNFAQALILKESERQRNKYKAIEIFEKLLKEVQKIFHPNHSYNYLIIIELLELLFIEAQESGEGETIEEINQLFEIIKNFKYQMNPLNILNYGEVKILEALYIFYIQGNLDKAWKNLKELEEDMKRFGIRILQEKINRITTKLESDIQKWKELLNSGVTTIERLEKSDFIEYIKNARNNIVEL